jgi:hypothetical protein
VVRLLILDVLGATALLSFWYLLFARYNRQKGSVALRWVQAACSDKGRVLEAHWLSTSRLQAHLGFSTHWFENARVTVRLLPRPLPIHWLISIWNKQKETVTFEADLDEAPVFHLEVFRHRWLTHNRRGKLKETSPNWSVFRPGPVVLTTRTEWAEELNRPRPTFSAWCGIWPPARPPASKNLGIAGDWLLPFRAPLPRSPLQFLALRSKTLYQYQLRH